MNALKATYKAWVSSIVGTLLLVLSVLVFFFNYPQEMTDWQAGVAFTMGLALLFTDPKELVMKIVDAIIRKKTS